MLDTTNPEIAILCIDIRDAIRAKRPLKPLLRKLRELMPDAPENDYELAQQAIQAAYEVMRR